MRFDRLNELRALRGYTWQDIADHTGISMRQVARIFSGESDPSADTITRLARALECSVDYLVGLVDEPTDHFREDDLSPIERRLIWAVRNGMIVEVLKTVTAISEANDKSVIPPEK